MSPAAFSFIRVFCDSPQTVVVLKDLHRCMGQSGGWRFGCVGSCLRVDRLSLGGSPAARLALGGFAARPDRGQHPGRPGADIHLLWGDLLTSCSLEA